MSSLEKLKIVIEKDETLSAISFNDDLLNAFLRAECDQVDLALNRIKVYDNVIKNKPRKWFGNFDAALAIVDLNLIAVSERTRSNLIVIVVKIGDWDPDTLSEDMLTAGILTIYEIFGTFANIVGIYDAKNYGIKQMRNTGLRNKFQISEFFYDTIPVKIHRTIHVNAGKVLRNLWKLVKAFIPKRISSNLEFCDDFSKLSDYLKQDEIWTEHGGHATYKYSFDLRNELLANEDNIKNRWLLFSSKK